MCLQTDNAGRNLASATISPGASGTMTCIYDNYNKCGYSVAVCGSSSPSVYLPLILGSDQDGTRNWGASPCPPSIAPRSGPVGSVPMAADDDTPSSGQGESFAAAGAIAGSPSTGTQSSIPIPTYNHRAARYEWLARHRRPPPWRALDFRSSLNA
jgi:hypothetical protein